MADKLTFQYLLEQKSTVDMEKLQAEVTKAEAEKAKVQEKLAGIDQRLKAMYRLSHGCGTGGKNGEKVFTSGEFWNHVKQAVGVSEDAVELGKKYEVNFPNSKEVTFQLIEE